MDVSAHHLVATGVALVGAAAVALTPVGPSLHSLVLRSQTVPPIAAAQLPGWMTEGAAGLAERIAQASGSPRTGGAVLPIPVPAPAGSLIAGAELGTAAARTSPALGPNPTPVPVADDALQAALDIPTPAIVTTYEELRSLVTTVAPVVGAVRDVTVGAVEEVGRVLRAIGDASVPIVAAMLQVPLAIANHILEAITGLVDVWTELRGSPQTVPTSTSAAVTATVVSQAPAAPRRTSTSSAAQNAIDDPADSAGSVAPTPVRSVNTRALPGDRDRPSTTARTLKRGAGADDGSTDARTATPEKKPPTTSKEAE